MVHKEHVHADHQHFQRVGMAYIASYYYFTFILLAGKFNLSYGLTLIATRSQDNYMYLKSNSSTDPNTCRY